MIGYWVSFALIAGLIPIGIFYFIHWLETKLKVEPTKEQKTQAYIKGIYYIAFYWLADLFYMAHFINNLVCKFVFGGLMLIIILVNVARSFSIPKIRNGFDRFGLIQDFLVAMALTVYLIYLIPNSTIQSIVIPVVAALYGGFITLVGVAWTIKNSDRIRKEEEIKKAEPLFTFNMLAKEPVGNIKKLCVPENLELEYHNEVYAEFENSDKSTVTFSRIYHDGNWFSLQSNTVMLPNKNCLISFRFADPLNIYLEVKDIFNKEYYYLISVVALGKMLGSKNIFHTIREIKPISKKELNELIREEPKK